MRSDRKRDIKPLVSLELKNCIYKLSFITNKPVKDVIEGICQNGLHNKKILSYLSQNFRRTVRIDNSIYMGDMERVPVKKRISSNQKERISTRVTANMHETISVIAYALDCSVSRATALLIDASVRDVDFLNRFVQQYLEKHIDDERMRELKKIYKYIRINNPYSEDVTWASFLYYMIDEVKIGAEKVQDTVSTFIVNKWND